MAVAPTWLTVTREAQPRVFTGYRMDRSRRLVPLASAQSGALSLGLFVTGAICDGERTVSPLVQLCAAQFPPPQMAPGSVLGTSVFYCQEAAVPPGLNRLGSAEL